MRRHGLLAGSSRCSSSSSCCSAAHSRTRQRRWCKAQASAQDEFEQWLAANPLPGAAHAHAFAAAKDRSHPKSIRSLALVDVLECMEALNSRYPRWVHVYQVTGIANITQPCI